MHYVINNRWALGDTVCISAAVRDFALAYGPRHKITVTGHYASYWRNNPYVTEHVGSGSILLPVQYGNGMEAARRGEPVHFATWFHREFKRLAGLDVPVTCAGGDIHLTLQQRRRPIDERYWVVVAGGKTDMTAKWWLPSRWQQTVDRLQQYGIRCVQAGAHFTHHIHSRLQGCIDFTGRTDSIHDLFSLIHGAEGVICGITGPMHIAAALDRPCVVLAGGREAPAWEAYVNDFNAFAPVQVRTPHRFLHTVGLLPCAKAHGCWKTRTVAIEAADLATATRRDKLCTEPVRDGNLSVPLCMREITVDHVVEAAMSYYEEGRLPPIGKPKGTYPANPNNPGLEHVGGITRETINDALKLAPRIGVEGGPVDAQELKKRYGPPQLQTLGSPNKPPQEFKEEALYEDPAFKILDDPVFGGKVTICILSHGDQLDFFKRCLEGIINTVPAHRREIRVAMNQPTDRLRQFAQHYVDCGIDAIYATGQKRYKYPAMREMFYDPDLPLNTKYLVWFDDDSYPVDVRWLVRLAETIIPNHRNQVRLFGKLCLHDLQLYNRNGHNPRKWFEEAAWWKNAPLNIGRSDRVGPNGSVIPFVAGWFWAASVAAIKACDIPDVRLQHNGGDCCIGAQIRQGGFKVKDFNQDKRYVFTPPKHQGGRRGYSEAFPWADPETRANHVPGT